MAEIKIVAEARSEFGKGAARRIRRESKVPAVLYGHGAEPIHMTLPAHEMMLALRQSNALFSVDLEGTKHLAVVKDVQRDPIRPILEHVDLLTVRAGEKITVDVPVHVVGESAPGTIHIVESQTLQVEAEATHLPENIEVSIEGLEAGAVVRVSDIKTPKGITILADADADVLSVSVPQSEESEDAAAGESATEAAAE